MNCHPSLRKGKQALRVTPESSEQAKDALGQQSANFVAEMKNPPSCPGEFLRVTVRRTEQRRLVTYLQHSAKFSERCANWHNVRD